MYVSVLQFLCVGFKESNSVVCCQWDGAFKGCFCMVSFLFVCFLRIT